MHFHPGPFPLSKHLSLFQISFWFGRAQPDIKQLMLRLQTCMRWAGPRQIRHSTHRALSQQCPFAEGSAVICSCFQAMLQLEKEPIKSYWVQKRSKEQICILPVKRNTVIGLNRIPGTSMDKKNCQTNSVGNSVRSSFFRPLHLRHILLLTLEFRVVPSISRWVPSFSRRFPSIYF